LYCFLLAEVVRRPSKRKVSSAPHSPAKQSHHVSGQKRSHHHKDEQQQEQMMMMVGIKEEEEEEQQHLPSNFAAALPDERETMLKRQRLCCPGDEQQQDDVLEVQEGEDEDDPVAAAIEAFTSTAPTQGLNSALVAMPTPYGTTGADGGGTRPATPFDCQQGYLPSAQDIATNAEPAVSAAPAAAAGNLRQYASAPLQTVAAAAAAMAEEATRGLARASSSSVVLQPTATPVLQGSVVMRTAAAAVAASSDGSGNLLAQEIQQLQQLQARLQQAASQPMMAAAMAVQCWPGISAATVAAAAQVNATHPAAAPGVPVGPFCMLPQAAALTGDVNSSRSSEGCASAWGVVEKTASGLLDQIQQQQQQQQLCRNRGCLIPALTTTGAGTGYMPALLADGKQDVGAGYDSAAAAAEPPIVSMQDVQPSHQGQQDAYAGVTSAGAAATGMVVDSILATSNSSEDDNSGSFTAARPQGPTDLSSNDLSTSYDEIDTLLSKPDAPFDLSMGLGIPAGLAGGAGYGIFNGGSGNGYFGGYGTGGWGRGFGAGIGGIFDL
jgi:hypothetical protein